MAQYVAQGNPDECWAWTGYVRNGYGRLMHQNHLRTAHRVAWELAYGPIPIGMQVLHQCDNPPCCNPAHLYLGTPADNIKDMMARGRHVSMQGMNNGNAKLTDADILTIRSSQETHRKLATRFGVSVNLIGLIRRRSVWRHL